MQKKVTFQPTIRPDWGGVLSYISNDEKAAILEAIIKYPSQECSSPFWLDTIKPDLDLQYEKFLENCEKKRLAVNKRWQKNTDVYTVKDKEKEKDKEEVKEENKEELANYETLFFDFWSQYIPVKCDGYAVGKGNKRTSFEKFVNILKKGTHYEDIIRGLREYLKFCQQNNQLTCSVPVFLNQRRWEDDYNFATMDGEQPRRKQQEPDSILEPYAQYIAEHTPPFNV